MTDIGRKIREMIEDSMLSAYIVSPRFDDYEIEAVEIPNVGIEQSIEADIRKIVEEYGRKSKNTYDQHVKAYGKYKRLEDKAAQSDLMGKVGQLQGLMRNPGGFLLSKLTMIAPQLAIIMLPFILPEIAKHVIKVLTQPGFPLDPRFKRRLEEEYNSFLSRQTQFNSAIGARNVVVQTKAGWINMNGAGHRSAMKDIREGTGRGVRQGFIGIEDKSLGING